MAKRQKKGNNKQGKSKMKLESIQQGKLFTSYGGPGSIVETIGNGSMLIQPYNNWFCYCNPIINGNQNPNNWIIQNGIDTRLKQYLCVDNLVRIPNEEDFESRKPLYAPTDADLQKTVKAERFPSWWFKTNGDRTMKKYTEWCDNNGNRPGNIEQVRFVLASLDSGKVIDVPFDLIWDYVRNNPGTIWEMDNTTPTTGVISYHTSRSSDGLQSISIKMTTGQETLRITMAQLDRVYFIWRQGENQGAYKLYVRSANNLYYPTIINSIYIPEEPNRQKAADLEEYNRQEYDFLAELQIDRYMGDPNLKVLGYPNLRFAHVKKIRAIIQLKLTSALTEYTRIYTPEYDENGDGIIWFDINNGQEHKMSAKKVYTRPVIMRNQSSYFPVTESYGEGIFFDLDVDNIAVGDRLTFTHTFSHMIMKELEFICGYPVSSLREKIYQNGNDHFGVLIYAAGGSEGSYGGLISLFPDDINATDGDILKIMQNASIRAKHCVNDPICANDKGHCFACIDVPEISCSKFNKNLDRNIVNNYLNHKNINYGN